MAPPARGGGGQSWEEDLALLGELEASVLEITGALEGKVETTHRERNRRRKANSTLGLLNALEDELDAELTECFHSEQLGSLYAAYEQRRDSAKAAGQSAGSFGPPGAPANNARVGHGGHQSSTMRDRDESPGYLEYEEGAFFADDAAGGSPPYESPLPGSSRQFRSSHPGQNLGMSMPPLREDEEFYVEAEDESRRNPMRINTSPPSAASAPQATRGQISAPVRNREGSWELPRPPRSASMVVSSLTSASRPAPGARRGSLPDSDAAQAAGRSAPGARRGSIPDSDAPQSAGRPAPGARRGSIPDGESDEPKLTCAVFVKSMDLIKTVSFSRGTTVKDIFWAISKEVGEQLDNCAIFHVDNVLGIERPLRDYERVDTVISALGQDVVDADNIPPSKDQLLMVKKYEHCEALAEQSVYAENYPPHFGWLHVETKPGKWVKRFVSIKDGVVAVAKDGKGASETVLCSLLVFDVYTLTKPRKGAPYKHCFCLRAQKAASFFEHPEVEYAFFLSAEHLDKMEDWVFSLRSARSPTVWEQEKVRREFLAANLKKGEKKRRDVVDTEIFNRGGANGSRGRTNETTSAPASMLRSPFNPPGKLS